MKGLFISFEGPDGSGKTTQIGYLKNYLEEIGHKVVVTREPGGTVISEKIRKMILDPAYSEMDDRTEVLLYAASRAQHVAEFILPHLEQGYTVLCDRFVDSSIVYQGYGRALGEQVREINEFAIKGCMPDITFLFKIDPAKGKKRITDHDRLEMEGLEYHNTVYDAYLALEKIYPKRIKSINAEGTIEAIHHDIVEILRSFLNHYMR